MASFPPGGNFGKPPQFGQPQNPMQGGYGQPNKPMQGGYGQPNRPMQGGYGQPNRPMQGGLNTLPLTQPMPYQPNVGQPQIMAPPPMQPYQPNVAQPLTAPTQPLEAQTLPTGVAPLDGRTGTMSPEMQAYYAQDFANQAQRGQMGTAPPPPGMAMGGPVGMPPPHPYAQQMGREDPRMQAMRRMQMMNLRG